MPPVLTTCPGHPPPWACPWVGAPRVTRTGKVSAPLPCHPRSWGVRATRRIMQDANEFFDARLARVAEDHNHPQAASPQSGL